MELVKVGDELVMAGIRENLIEKVKGKLENWVGKLLPSTDVSEWEDTQGMVKNFS